MQSAVALTLDMLMQQDLDLLACAYLLQAVRVTPLGDPGNLPWTQTTYCHPFLCQVKGSHTCFLAFSSLAWAFICCTSKESAFLLRIKRSWFPMHSCRICPSETRSITVHGYLMATSGRSANLKKRS